VVQVHGSGRALLYGLNTSHPFAGALATLLEEEQRRWERLLARIRETPAENRSYTGAVTLMVAAAIAYADAITAKQKGVVNKQNHQAASRLMREAL
jgi:hypothetical protein